MDTAGHVWRSEGRYRVGVGGTLELGDADRPWWDMAFADTAAAPVAFSAPDTELEFTVEVRAGAESASAGVTRCWGRDVSREDLSGDGWRLRVYCPHTDRQSAPAVLVVPGTTGLAAAAPTAALLASHGFVAGVLAYMQESGLPDTFQRIPLEAAASGVQAFTTRADVAPARLTILAYSVGTTLTLALLSSDDAPRVRA